MSDNNYEPGPSKPKLIRFNDSDVNAYIELKLQEHNNSSLVVVNISPQQTDYESSDDDVINATIAPASVSSSQICLNSVNDEHGNNIKTTETTENTVRTFDFAATQQILVYPPPKHPIDYFMSIVDNDFLTNLTDKTNKNAVSSQDLSKKGPKWKKVTLSEMKTFIGLLLHTGTIQMSRLGDYWKKHYLFNLSCFSNFMSRNRFCSILRYLSFGESDNFENQSLNKIGFVLDYFNNNMNRIYYPGRQLILDESVVLWRRQMTLCQNKKGKRHRDGIRLYALKEPDGTVIKFHLTAEKNEATENMINIASSLLEGKLDKGHAIFMNECFSLHDLALILLERYTYSTGLLKKNEENIPTLIETAELKNENKSKIIYFDGVHYGIFRDSRNVKTKYISTQYGESFTDITTKNGEKVSKPTALVEFNKYFCDNDQHEDMMAYYPCNRKNLFWHKKMFIHVLQMSMVNSYLLYNKYSGQNLPLYNFRFAVLEALLPEKQVAKVPFIHRLSKIENVKIRQKKDNNDTYRTITEIVRKECRNCRNIKKVRSSTVFECKSCEDSPGFCVECFFACH